MVIVPSKSVKKMNFGFVRMAGRFSVEGAMVRAFEDFLQSKKGETMLEYSKLLFSLD